MPGFRAGGFQSQMERERLNLSDALLLLFWLVFRLNTHL